MNVYSGCMYTVWSHTNEQSTDVNMLGRHRWSVAARTVLGLIFWDMFWPCAVNHASILHEVEPNNSDFRCDYMVPGTILVRVYKTHNSIQEVWVAEAISGRRYNNLHRWLTNELRTRSGVFFNKLALTGSYR